MPEQFDIVIVGAGPAGCCAAIRLAHMGYRIALIEQRTFPRPQIGESLSNGLFNLFEYLDIGHILQYPSYLYDLPARILWEEKGISTTRNGAGGLIVDRSIFDEGLLQGSIAAGVRVFQPATFLTGHPVITYLHEGIEKSIHTRLILDARGRAGIRASERIRTTSPSIAIWTEIPGTIFPQESRVEALADAWLWGCPLPGNRYRIMAMADARSIAGKRPLNVLQRLLHDSLLLGNGNIQWPKTAIHTCTTVAYFHKKPWQEKVIRLGEAAFGFDPLSSGGVEKAMRFSLQACVAVNTMLQYNDTALARSFYEDCLAEAMTTHSSRTVDFYRRAWPDTSFWNDRRVGYDAADPAVPDSTDLEIDAAEIIRNIYCQPARLSPLLAYSPSHAVVDDHLEIKMAVTHPSLRRKMIYLDQIELKPLLDMVEGAGAVRELLARWHTKIPLPQAARLVAFLWHKRLLY